MTSAQTHQIIWTMGIIMSVVIVFAGIFIKDPPKNWWPTHIDPLNWKKDKRTPADIRNNPPAPHQYNIKEMWSTPQAKWLGVQHALFIGAGLFGVNYFYNFAQAMHLGSAAAAVGSAGFALADGIGRPLAGLWSAHWGRRRVMATSYASLAVFQLAAFISGYEHSSAAFIIFAFLSGALSGVNFPLTALTVSDYYGENNNSGMYGTVYAWKSLGGGFAGGIAAMIMTGSVFGGDHFYWVRGFVFGIVLCLLASFVVFFLCKTPTMEQVKRAIAKASGRSIEAVEAEMNA